MSYIVAPSRSATTVASSDGKWRRSPVWLPLPEVADTDDKIVGLYAVYPDPNQNYLAFTISGDYTVDWGDGTVQNYTAGSKAEKTFSYSSFTGTEGPVTFVDNGDLVVRANHGYNNGDYISFDTINTTSGISPKIRYYVVNATTNSFQVSTNIGGSPVTLTGDGNGQILSFRQAIITITPQAGQNFTSVDLGGGVAAIHSALADSFVTFWLELTVAAPLMTSVNFGGVNPPRPTILEILRLKNNSLTSTNGLCFRWANLKQAEVYTNNVTDMANMFGLCYSLQEAPMLNTSNVTTMFQMFTSCFNLKKVPLYDTSQVTNMSRMFSQAVSLPSIPRFNTANVTNINLMCNFCASLVDVPLLDFSNVTDAGGAFTSCHSLSVIPPFNLSSATNIANLFSSCFNITTIPAINLNSAVSGPSSSSVFPFRNISSFKAFNIKFSLDLSNNSMSAVALDLLYTNLGTVFSGETLNVSGNPGVSGDNPSIATAKGWTVIG